jgi:lipopolysaccharide biosynthesis glycosyltransferase
VNASVHPAVVAAADDGYGLGLAVAIRSAIDHLDPARRLRLFLLDGGISPRMRRRLLRCWPAERLELTWLNPDPAPFRAVAVPGVFSQPAVYMRLLADELLPSKLDRVIYLDSDVLVLRDLGELWDLDMGGRALLAVQDQGVPFVDAQIALERFDAVRPHLWKARGVENWRELGLDPKAPYLNSGVLMMDLATWRREGIGRKLLDCIRSNPDYTQFPDQYALNAYLCGRWGELDLRWNANPGIFKFPSAEESPFDVETLRQVREDPWIVHYVGHVKPWSWDGATVWKEIWQRECDATGWPPWARARWTLWPWLHRRWLRWSRPLRRSLRHGRRALSRTTRRLRTAAHRRLSG